MSRHAVMLHLLLGGTFCASLAGAGPAPIPREGRDAVEAPMLANPGGKSVGVAYASALAGTVLPIAVGTLLMEEGGANNYAAGWLVAGGILLGPSTGQFYAQSLGHGLLASLVRTAGAGMLFVGILQGLDFESDEEGEPDDDNQGAGLRILGTATFLGGVAFSLIDTYFAVERYRKKQRVPGYSLEIAPTLSPAAGGGLHPGAMALIRF
jgi:hypothetical protein